MCHSSCQALSLPFLIRLFALLKVYTVFAWEGRSLACFFAFLSAISFPSIPVWPGIHCTVIRLPGCSQVLAASLNCLKTPWLEPFVICPALHATLRLCRKMWTPGATRAMGLFKACVSMFAYPSVTLVMCWRQT